MVHTREVMLKMRPLLIIIVIVVLISQTVGNHEGPYCLFIPNWGK